MTQTEASLLKTPRYPALDAARGVALVAMFVFHLCWDLSFFGLVPPQLEFDPRFHAFGHAIAASFVALAGVGLALAARRGVDWGRALQRIGKIAAAALVVTVATWFIFPDAYIFFGILHLMAVAGLLCLPLLRAPSWLVALIAAAAIALPFAIASSDFNAPALLWLGLGTKIPVTNDWRPLLPWYGVMLVGVLAGRAIIARGLPFGLGDWRPRGVAGRALVLGGRHSLLLYLVHQPVFVGLVFIVATLSGPLYKPSLQSFHASCEQQCVASGGQAGLCSRACGCIVEDAAKQGMGDAVAMNRLTPEQKKSFDEITKACIRQTAPIPPAP